MWQKGKKDTDYKQLLVNFFDYSGDINSVIVISMGSAE